MKKICIFAFLFLTIFNSLLFAQDSNLTNQRIDNKLNQLNKPLYNPFVENYILNELKLLREENRDLKVDLHETLAKKEVAMTNNAINYATSTINNMFYIIAAACSLLVIIGWNSIRDVNEKTKNIIDEKVSNIISDFEKRMSSLESDLEKRSKQVIINQKEIEKTNILHSLWMRASQESTPTGKIEIYDEILSIREDDVEALTYKADAILDIGEANWALNLTNQALSIDENYSNAFYQRAKVYAVLGFEDNAIDDIEKALESNEHYVIEIENDEEFITLKEKRRLKNLLNRYTQKS